ncbi:MAG: hypothetical protein U1E87_04465 [Alphaproteobacteria bacterium]
MPAFQRVVPALIALAAGLQPVAAGAQGAGHGAWGRLGALRSPLGQLSQGLSVSLTQGARYDSNIVRTANDTETFALYGRTQSADWVSQTGANISYNLEGARSNVTFSGDVSYAKYFEYDEFSGWVASGGGAWSWNFTHRCTSTVDARAVRSLANFADISSSQNTFQTGLDGGVDVSCFILERLRVNAGVFASEVRNDKSAFKINNLRSTGYDASLAVVTRQKNEVGFHYRASKTERPNAPLVDDFKYEQFDAYGLLHMGNRFRLFASGGVQKSERENSSDEFSTGTGIVGLDWFPSARLSAHIGYDRSIQDATDLVGTSRRTDRVAGDIGWAFPNRIQAGGYASYTESTLDSGLAGPLTGVKEKDQAVGGYLRHNLFQLVRVEWNAGWSRRESDIALREYDSVTAGVSIGIAI